MVPARSRCPAGRREARRIFRDVARAAAETAGLAEDLDHPRLSLAEPDLARESHRHRTRRRDRFPGHRAGAAILRRGVAAPGRPHRRARGDRTDAAVALHQGTPRQRRELRRGRLRRALRHHVGAAEHASAWHLRPPQPPRRQAALSASPAADLDLSPALPGASRARPSARLVSRQRPAAPKASPRLKGYYGLKRLIRSPIYRLLAKTPVIWRRSSRMITGLEQGRWR